VNGATGVSGQQAVQVAKYLGARRVVATGRDEATLGKLPSLGADEIISLLQSKESLAGAFRTALAGIDVVLDYLWGESAECILAAAKGHGSPEGEPRLRYVQIGAISGDPISLKAELLRSSGVELLGSGLGSLSALAIVDALRAMFDAQAAGAGLKIDAEAVSLQKVEMMWNCTPPAGRRIVFTI
jgi:NADPH:quinone reductase-like Zn-dependent oxidoreductase